MCKYYSRAQTVSSIDHLCVGVHTKTERSLYSMQHTAPLSMSHYISLVSGPLQRSGQPLLLNLLRGWRARRGTQGGWVGGRAGSWQTGGSEMGIMGWPEALQHVQQPSRLICGGGNHANPQSCPCNAHSVLRRTDKVLVFVGGACTWGAGIVYLINITN